MICSCLLGAAVVLLVLVFNWYSKKTFNYWNDQNVPNAPDPVAAFGHMLPVITLKESFVGFAERLYKQTDASMMGFYFLRTPGIIVRDPEIVKSVMQTNFSSFRLNLIALDDDCDPVLSKNPFFSANAHTWKSLRTRTISYLTGKKLRVLYEFIAKVSAQMNDFIEKNVEENNGAYECKLKDFFERYTGEFVANAAFGVRGESFESQPRPKSFNRVAKRFLEPTSLHGIKQALLFYLPALGKFFGLSFLEKSAENYFRDTLKYIVDERKRKGTAANDYLQFCIEQSSSSDEDFNVLVADVIIFFMDSYDTSSLTLSVLIYFLSKHPEIQEKLRQHVKSVVDKAGGKVTYESLKEMTYLDQVMSESMRMIPSLGLMQRMCTEEITLKGSDGITCHLKPGQPVVIPTAALQTDGRFWTDPEVFNPDRFSPENQKHHNKFTYMPFGEGPRMCVGMRLGQMLVKYAIASLILKFSLVRSSITKEPLERNCNTIMSYHKGGLWAKFERLC